MSASWQKWLGGYSLDLYCRFEGKWPDMRHEFDEFPHQYCGETFGECARMARSAGWVIHRDQTATCPKCATRQKRPA